MYRRWRIQLELSLNLPACVCFSARVCVHRYVYHGMYVCVCLCVRVCVRSGRVHADQSQSLLFLRALESLTQQQKGIPQ